MPRHGLTDHITERPWAEGVTVWYTLVDDACQRLIAKRGKPLRANGPEPRFSDSEVITVSFITVSFFQEHEKLGSAFVSQHLRDIFPNLIAVIAAIRKDLRGRNLKQGDEPFRLVDSAPVVLMTYSRGARRRSVVGSQFFGSLPARKASSLAYTWPLRRIN